MFCHDSNIDTVELGKIYYYHSKLTPFVILRKIVKTETRNRLAKSPSRLQEIRIDLPSKIV